MNILSVPESALPAVSVWGVGLIKQVKWYSLDAPCSLAAGEPPLRLEAGGVKGKPTTGDSGHLERKGHRAEGV